MSTLSSSVSMLLCCSGDVYWPKSYYYSLAWHVHFVSAYVNVVDVAHGFLVPSTYVNYLSGLGRYKMFFSILDPKILPACVESYAKVVKYQTEKKINYHEFHPQVFYTYVY